MTLANASKAQRRGDGGTCTSGTMALSLLLLGALLTSQAMASCSDRTAMTSFDEDRFLGKWYHIKQTTFQWPGGNTAKCQHIFFNRATDGDIDINVSFYNTSTSSYTPMTIHIEEISPGISEAKFQYHREGEPEGRISKWNFVGTDYDNYAVTWICSKKPKSEETFEVDFLLTREKNPSASVLQQASVLLPTADYTTNDHADCPSHEHR